MEGMIKKYKKGDEEFDLPQGLLDLYKKKDYGMYKDKDGQLHVNFLSNNDITGVTQVLQLSMVTVDL